MSRRTRPRRLALLLALAALGPAGCGGNHASDDPGPGPSGADAADAATADTTALDAAGAPLTPGGEAASAADTARGVVAVVGAEPLTHVVLRTAAGPVTVDGPVADELRRLVGVEVRVRGESRDGAFAASSFRVRGVGDLPAADGVLELSGDTAILVAADGTRRRFGPVPGDLRRLAGQRVWIAGRPGETPESWGVIAP